MSRKSTQLGLIIPDLPETNNELFQGKGTTLKHRVDTHFMNGLYERVRPFVRSTEDDRIDDDKKLVQNTVEGKVKWDRARAAVEARQYFVENQDDFCASKTIDEIDKALEWCLRQHQIGRSQRVKAAIEAAKPPEETPPQA